MVESELKAIPKHLVIIPDGNVRWAQKHRVSPEEGYAAGIGALKGVLSEIDNLDGLDVVTVWGFSTENWVRPEDERMGVMTVVEHLLANEGEDLAQRGYRFRHIGRRDRLPESLVGEIARLEERTATNTKKTVVMGFDYGGRDEIIRAVSKLGGQAVDSEGFKEFLDTAGLPDPDLIVRTSGEYRTSGIYPYQGVYAEFVSSPVLMPDFDRAEFHRCLQEYASRQRNFGNRLAVSQESPFSWLGLEEPSFVQYLEAVLPQIDRVSNDLIAGWRNGRIYKDSPPLQEDIAIFEQLLSHGKKLRSALGLLSYEAFAGEGNFRKGVMKAMLAYEIIHNAFLIHDDVYDNALTRRGAPSVHEQYRLRHEAEGGFTDHSQYGLAVAINTGSLGAFRALDIIAGIDNKPDRVIKAERWVRYVIEKTLQGERLDLTDISLDKLTKQDVYRVYHQKTAVYTVIGPLVLGAILAGASKRELDHLNTFGVNLGIAFQMIDDHLGVYGDEQLLGKPGDADIKEGKKTLHFVEGYERARGEEREFLRTVWGNSNLTIDQLDQTRVLLERLGVKDFVLERVTQIADKARRVIPKISYDPAMRVVLDQIIDFVVQRQF